MEMNESHLWHRITDLLPLRIIARCYQIQNTYSFPLAIYKYARRIW